MSVHDDSEPEKLIDFLIHKGNGVKGLSQLNLKKIPSQFIQPPEQRLSHIHVSTQKAIPTIDVSQWNDPMTAQSICEAAKNWGFFQIVNHGIPLEVLENVKTASHDFFGLPVEERRKYLKENSPTQSVILKTSFSPFAEKVLEWKDYLLHLVGTQIDDADFELWPSVCRAPVSEYMNRVRPVIQKLLQTLLNGIKVTQIDEAKESALMGSLLASLLHYPKCPNPDLAAGARPHTDISSLTVLLQDNVGGLYVRLFGTSDEWAHVTPIEGSLVVNVGDVLEIMSNGRYKSVEHRVFVDRNRDRVSVPVFANPLADTVIGPLPEAMDDGERLVYRQLVYSDYLVYLISKGHDGKQTIDYAKL